MSARLSTSVGGSLHTYFMSHELLWSALNAQQANATLIGPQLRAAAEELLRMYVPGRMRVMALDAAGERIIGAALAMRDEHIEMFDYTEAFAGTSTCLLIGGFIAGPAGVEAAATAVTGAGATRVEAAVIGGWSAPIRGVSRVRELAGIHVRVA
ncbi:MAG: hypothetical protein QM638_09655 [Nocardioides sp.]|uniref:hypothetical protein n=1 Tax=Nocardioides sp. TaxID=35761 RepID=UPI0039E49B56